MKVDSKSIAILFLISITLFILAGCSNNSIKEDSTINSANINNTLVVTYELVDCNVYGDISSQRIILAKRTR